MKKKSKKVLLLAGMATATIGITAILHNGYMQQAIPESQNFIQAYKHNPSSILDNLYKKDNMTILPFIFENSDQSITKDKIVSEFDNKKLTVTSISTGDKIGTGTQIKVKENAVTYTVVIYGDVNGDGEVNVFDAQECVDNFVNNGENLKGAYKIAANVENTDDEADVFDAQKIVDFFVGIENKLVANEPASTYETDNEAPVISVNGQVVTDTYNMPNIKVGNSYNPPTITAIDNIDGDITASIIESGDTVNTNVAGTYRVNYSVSDTKGNNSQITIIVTVENNSSSGGGGGNRPSTPTLNKIELGENGETIEEVQLPINSEEIKVPITFYKSDGSKTNLTTNNIKVITGNSVDSGKLGIKLPSMKILGKASTTDNNIKVTYYDKDDNKINNTSTPVAKIGFTISNSNIKIDELNNLGIKFYIGSNLVEELPVEITYDDITAITFEDSGYASIINGYYTVRKGYEFVLGVLKSGVGERPVTENDMKEASNGIKYDFNDNGELLVKGTINEVGTYNNILLKTNVAGVPDNISININVIDMPAPEDLNIVFNLEDDNGNIVGEVSESKPIHLDTTNDWANIRLAITSDNKDKSVLYEYIRCVQDESKLDIALLTDGGGFATTHKEVKIINLINLQQGTGAVTVTVKLFEGCPGLETEAKFKVIID